MIAIDRATGPLGARVTALLSPLVPPGATTRIRTGYDVPFDRPEITSGLTTDAGLRVTQFAPSSTEYRIFVGAAPPSDPNANATRNAPSSADTPVIAAAAGATAVTWNDDADDVAASRLPLAATLDVTEHVPADTNDTRPVTASIAHTPGVDVANETAPPDRDGVAAITGGVAVNA